MKHKLEDNCCEFFTSVQKRSDLIRCMLNFAKPHSVVGVTEAYTTCSLSLELTFALLSFVLGWFG